MWKKLSCYVAFQRTILPFFLVERTYKCDDTLVYSSLSAHAPPHKHFVPSLKRGTHYKLEDGRFVPSKGDDEIVDIRINALNFYDIEYGVFYMVGCIPSPLCVC